MKIRSLSRRLVALAVIVASVSAHGYDHWGHQAVGAIADKLLQGTKAGDQVNAILAGMSLQTAAVWADCVKGTTTKDGQSFVYENDDSMLPECSAFGSAAWKARNESYVSRNWKQCGTARGHEYCHSQYHYADVSTRRDHYDPRYVGANDHDVVHAINAAVAVLRGDPAPAPFSIADRQEALMLLAHYLGDIHQPLHVAAVYLDSEGRVLDPDLAGYQVEQDTGGGNLVFDGSTRFHFEWDAVPAELAVGGAKADEMLAMAKAVTPPPGDIMSWSTQWASETIAVGKPAFDRLVFSRNPYSSRPPEWTVWGMDDLYRSDAAALKEVELAKAGGRLARLLMAIWPEAGTPKAAGYLSATDLPDIAKWLPRAPDSSGALQKLDDDVYQRTRSDIAGARGALAGADDVFKAADLLPRFQASLGVLLTPRNAPRLVALVDKAEIDVGAVVAPYKKRVSQGGRVRPFVAHPDQVSCFQPVDLTGHARMDLDTYDFAGSGSYPSTHALVGMLMGLVLTELSPQHGAEVLARGMEFGQSRVVCGFHYQSDVDAGRLVAAALFARLQQNAAFIDDLEAARVEVAAALNLP